MLKQSRNVKPFFTNCVNISVDFDEVFLVLI
jgi:hypothetical protein